MSADANRGIVLRPWRRSDASTLVEAHRDPLLRQWLKTHLADEEQALAWIDLQLAAEAEGRKIAFAVLLDGGEVPVGHVAVHSLTPDQDLGEIGYWTAPAVRGRGVAVAAVRAALAEAVLLDRVVPLRRFDLLHTVGNEGSCRVAQKAGFELIGMLPPMPQSFPFEGHRHRLTLPRPEDQHMI